MLRRLLFQAPARGTSLSMFLFDSCSSLVDGWLKYNLFTHVRSFHLTNT